MKAVAPASTKCSRECAPAFVVAAAMTLLPSRSSALEHSEVEAYAADGGLRLYRESRWRYDEDDVASGRVICRCPDGTAFARKHIRATRDAQAPDFKLRDARNGYVEGVREDHGSRQVFTRTSAATTKRAAPIQGDKSLIVDAGFDAFVCDHGDPLASSPATAWFAVPSRLEAMRFRVRQVAEGHVGGRIVQRFRLSVANWYGGLLPHIDVVYDAVSRRLHRYVGISNVQDRNVRNVVVRVEFPQSDRDTQATQTQFAAAAAMPLTGTCPLS